MKNKLLLSIALGSLIVSPVFASAEEMSGGMGTSTEAKKREMMKNQMEERRENMKNEMENKREEMKDKMEERRENATEKIQERIHKFIKNVIERFNAAIERLDKIATRIESRIAKLKTENIDTEKAEELLVIAKAKIKTAKDSVAAIKLNTPIVVSQSDATTASSTDMRANKEALKEVFKAVKAQIEKAKKDIKEAHAALVDVIKNLKPGLHREDGKKETNASTTNTQ